jgi:hypothetical protein
MKKLLAFVLLTVMYSFGANAAANVADISDIDFGSIGLGRSDSAVFNLTNNGNVTLTGVSFGFSQQAFNFQTDKSGFSLGINQTEPVKFTVTVPEDFSTGNIKLGTVSMFSNQLNIASLFDVSANVGGGLVIEDLDVSIVTIIYEAGRRKTEVATHTDVQEGQRLNFGDRKIKPRTELEFNFNIDNTFKDDEDIDIDNVVVRVTVLDIDDGDDIEEESDEFRIASGKSADADVFVNIPLSVKEGVYDVLIEVEGDDDDGNTHTAEMSLEFDVDKESREIIVSAISIFPGVIICSGTSSVTGTIKNLGKRLESDAGIEIKNTELGLNSARTGIELEEDPFDNENEFTHTATIIVEDGARAGTYPITVNAILEQNIVWESRNSNLVVEACGSEEKETQEEPEPAVEQTVNDTLPLESSEEPEKISEDGIKVPVLKSTTTTEIPLTKRTGFWAFIIAFNIVVVGALAYFVLTAKK